MIIFSYSLYGVLPRYVLGMYENLRLIPLRLPGARVEVHIEKGHYAIPKLERMGAFIVEHEPEGDSGGMMWRLSPVNAGPEDHICFRDADSRVTPRDVFAIQEWVASGKALHHIHDHPHHTRPIVGGCWGLRGAHLAWLQEELAKWPRTRKYGDDEDFLQNRVYPHFSGSQLAHHTSTLPPRPEGEPHICEQVPPPWQGYLEKFYVLNPDHYRKRFERFKEGVTSSRILSRMECVRLRGTTAADRVRPSWFSRPEYPHYYFASRDHADLIERAILGREDLLLVFEDDAVPTPDFDLYFERMWNSLPQSWMGAMLGGQPQTDDRRVLVGRGLEQHLAGVRGCLGFHANLWSRRGMVRFHDHYAYWGRDTIDQAFTILQQQERHFYAPAKWIVRLEGEQFGKDH
jgi:hypothetical protein